MFATVLFRELPTGLDAMPPGPELGRLLASIDVRALSAHDRVVVLRAQARMVAHHQAEMYDAVAAIEECFDPGDAADGTAAEIRPALQLTRRAADAEVDMAWQLRVRLPRVWALLAAGEIDLRRARVIVDGMRHLGGPAADGLVDRVVDVAPRLTTGQLRARLRKWCIEADPDDARERYEHAVERRRVVAEPTPDHTADIYATDLPPDRVAAAMRHVNEITRSLRRDGEMRSMDQLRADVLLDLLSGTTEARGGGVELTVDLTTLAGLSEAPGEVAGYGPVLADVARQIVERQEGSPWRWSVVDPDTGRVDDTGTTRRRPTADQRRAVRARSRTCVFPGCRMPAVDCDIDHRIPWSERPRTITRDLAPACRHDHNVRHRFGWTYRPLPDGDFEWTTALGHTYTASGKPP